MKSILWAIFGNDEDSVDGPEWFLPGRGKWERRIRWWLRNPFHNLFWHVIGIEGKPFKRYGRHPRHVWNPHGGWNWAVIHYRWLRLPFVSWRGKRIEFYMGWRERGALGFAIRPARSN